MGWVGPSAGCSYQPWQSWVGAGDVGPLEYTEVAENAPAPCEALSYLHCPASWGAWDGHWNSLAACSVPKWAAIPGSPTLSRVWFGRGGRRGVIGSWTGYRCHCSLWQVCPTALGCSALHHAVAVSHQTWNSAFLAANNLCQVVCRGKWWTVTFIQVVV